MRLPNVPASVRVDEKIPPSGMWRAVSDHGATGIQIDTEPRDLVERRGRRKREIVECDKAVGVGAARRLGGQDRADVRSIPGPEGRLVEQRTCDRPRAGNAKQADDHQQEYESLLEEPSQTKVTQDREEEADLLPNDRTKGA
jgi:hypothetical protein